jgi:hypothetical protein
MFTRITQTASHHHTNSNAPRVNELPNTTPMASPMSLRITHQHQTLECGGYHIQQSTPHHLTLPQAFDHTFLLGTFSASPSTQELAI